jgi:hypothetical protein
MSAVSLTVKALLAAPAVAAITTRIQPAPLEQGLALPAIAVALSAEDEETLLAGASQYMESSVQIHCLADMPDHIKLGEAVKNALRDLLFVSGGLYASFTKEPVDMTDFADDQSTARRLMSFSIRWR